MNHEDEVLRKHQEHEIRNLRAEFADVPVIRTVLALDLAIRRAAWSALGSQDSRSEGSSMSRSTPGSSTS